MNPPYICGAVLVFDCSLSASSDGARVPLLFSSVSSRFDRLPSRRQNAISNQFKCKLKTTVAYKLFDSPSKNTASKDQTEDKKTRRQEGGIYGGSDGRDRTRKGGPVEGARQYARPPQVRIRIVVSSFSLSSHRYQGRLHHVVVVSVPPYGETRFRYPC